MCIVCFGVWCFNADHENFYSGRVFGESDSSVRAHIEDKMVTGNIVLPDETYHIEVSTRIDYIYGKL